MRLPLAILAAGVAWVGRAEAATPSALAWPAPTATAKPWARWWWLGSAVDRPNLSRLLGEFREAGLGGVEICPIYGAKGYESRFQPFLSPGWMELVAFAARESGRLGLGFDFTTGTGWPMGGPWIQPPYASTGFTLQSYPVKAGRHWSARLPEGLLVALRATGPHGQSVDLLGRVHDGVADWTAPDGDWQVDAVLTHSPMQQVKRAAPGGEGNVLDPFSVEAIDRYLQPIGAALRAHPVPGIRAQFHDSFEYYGADWTPHFLEEFRRRRGYDLRDELATFTGANGREAQGRVKRDYRATLADLHGEVVDRWVEWSHANGSLAREQAHGAPANIEDLYAAADIPETEMMGPPDEGELPMLSFASSAAHLAGRPLASSESFTWLGEHFQETLADMKPETDLLFLAGINHLFFHGIPYSPADAPWPGWLFYASTNLGPNGGLWHDLPAYNAYATRCQSLLQAGRPANDLLLYFPVEDYWQEPEGTVELFTTPGKWMDGTAFHETALRLWHRGFSVDEVTDKFLGEAKVRDGRVFIGNLPFHAIVIPRTRLMAVETVRQLLALARAGATILFDGALPLDVPGQGHLEARRQAFRQLWSGVAWHTEPGTARRRAALGAGALVADPDVLDALATIGAPRETMFDAGLHCIRRRRPDGCDYFVVNANERAWDGWVTLGTAADAAVLLDPQLPAQSGIPAQRHTGAGALQVRLQMEPGESLFIRTVPRLPAGARLCTYWQETGAVSQPVAGPWSVQFVEGGPGLPAPYCTAALASWAGRNDPEAQRFGGTAIYRTEFEGPSTHAADWRLDLGRVCESARVRLNGQEIATLWHPPFSLAVGSALRPGKNVLEVEVTNLAANRIRDLDRRHVAWKSFYEINFVNRAYLPFDASGWGLRESGLLGPVTLTPLTPSVR